MIRAIIETSLIDWDGKITTVLFFDTCNFRCPFCQNWQLITQSDTFPVIEWDLIEKKLQIKKGWVDGVVLTGGEPLLHREEVLGLCKKIKNLGIAAKIDTNGAFPKVMAELFSQHLVDYVAMDIKAPLDETYDHAAGTTVDLNLLRESIFLIMNASLDYEFRTTCVPQLISEDAIRRIGKAINGAKKWVLQAYRPEHAYLPEYRKKLDPAYHQSLEKYLTIAREYVQQALLRGAMAK